MNPRKRKLLKLRETEVSEPVVEVVVETTPEPEPVVEVQKEVKKTKTRRSKKTISEG